MATQSTPPTSTTASSLKVKTHVKAGALTANHSQTLVRPSGLKVDGSAKDAEPVGQRPLRLTPPLHRPRLEPQG